MRRPKVDVAFPDRPAGNGVGEWSQVHFSEKVRVEIRHVHCRMRRSVRSAVESAEMNRPSAGSSLCEARLQQGPIHREMLREHGAADADRELVSDESGE